MSLFMVTPDVQELIRCIPVEQKIKRIKALRMISKIVTGECAGLLECKRLIESWEEEDAQINT